MSNHWLIIAAATLAACGGAGGADAGRPVKPADGVEIRNIEEIAGEFRPPAKEEITQLGDLWPNVPDDQNAAHWFALAVARLHTEAAPPGSEFFAGRRASYDGDVDRFRKWVESNQPAIDLMQEGLKRSAYRAPLVVHAPARALAFDVRYLSGLRHLARASLDAGLLDELEGRPRAALGRYLDCIRLASAECRRPTLIEILNATAVISMGLTSVDAIVAEGRLGEESLRTIITVCRAAEMGPHTPATVWQRDMAFTSAANAIHGNDAALNDALDGQKRFQTDVATVLARMTLDELLRRDAVSALYKRESREYAQVDLARGVVPIDGWLRELGRANVRLRATEIRAAIALYQLKHRGVLPQTLTALCPDALPGVPTDPFSGKPMQYAMTDHGWKVWSVGVNNVDDGGVSASSVDTLWETADAVFLSSIPSNIERQSATSGAGK